jgi:hypothetical protein
VWVVLGPYVALAPVYHSHRRVQLGCSSMCVVGIVVCIPVTIP